MQTGATPILPSKEVGRRLKYRHVHAASQGQARTAGLVRAALQLHGMAHPFLPKFCGDKQDGDTFDQWLQRLLQHAELDHWTDQQKLLQFELHLSGNVELWWP